MPNQRGGAPSITYLVRDPYLEITFLIIRSFKRSKDRDRDLNKVLSMITIIKMKNENKSILLSSVILTCYSIKKYFNVHPKLRRNNVLKYDLLNFIAISCDLFKERRYRSM